MAPVEGNDIICNTYTSTPFDFELLPSLMADPYHKGSDQNEISLSPKGIYFD